MSGLNLLPAYEIAARIRAGEATPSAVMRDHLDRIAAREPQIGAFQYLDAARAMERAEAADRSPVSGPLHGVPFAVKDIIDTADMPTGWGFDPYASRQPDRNAACVDAMIAAGAIPIGKTVTTEFAYFKPGKTANPHNPAHTPGGSSSGSAAAVADFMAPLALGSQTAASLVRPAAYCGVAAFRPTTGGFDLGGVMGLSPALDTLGVLARDVKDLILARAALTAMDLPPPPDFTDSLPRIQLMRGPHWQDGSIEMRDTCTRALQVLAATGAETGETAHPPVFASLTQAQITVMGYEAARARTHEFEAFRNEISPQFAALIEAGLKVSDAGYHAALATRDHANAILDQLLGDADALLVPSAPGPAPAGLEATGDPLFSRMWNLLQLPAVALPFGTDANGLPLGIQLIARRGDDLHLLNVAAWVQQALSLAIETAAQP
ncbi:glutamyl-tRNA amidotransferase [Leisingera sp. ANG-M1]|uniref:amidase n=1 Tax=Leisingera sp. ANG-M1 TaxID=1577895 RepID=UPI00057E5D78|nr:amidase [Leisingera sp. ANG-M1]KIC07643.1 glutamyl-tRNA amidotransferase [Leisingera sp. ANG-M1]